MAGTAEYEALAAEEASPIKESEKEIFNKLLEVLPPEHRKRAEEEPLDILIIVRGFQKDTPREEKTKEALMKIVQWRDRIEYFDFLHKQYEGFDAFHKFWPEGIYGTDKYGHFLQCIRVKEINIEKVEELGQELVEVLQGQKMRMYGKYKQQLSAKSGVQRYKHSLVIDLDGISMSLTSKKHREFLQRIFDVGTHFYPETMWKIYLLNSPYLFRGLWVVVKPWLHPITQAKVNVLGSFPSAMKAMEADGVPKEAMPDWMGGGCKGQVTAAYIQAMLAEGASGS